MSTQIARLFLRGSLCNVTIRNLSKEQQHRVSEVVNLVLGDPALQRARQSFIRALANTIGNEYKDPSCADEEVAIAIWRAAASALYHKPMPEVIENETQRKKFFQEWIFNSLRQILLENKIPSQRSDNIICGLNTKIGAEILGRFFEEHNIPTGDVVTRSDRHVMLQAEIMRLSLNELQSLWRIEKTLRNGGVKLGYDDKKYNIVHIRTKKPEFVEFNIPKTTSIKLVSFEQKAGDDDKELRCKLEYSVASENGAAEQDRIEFDDIVSLIRDRLPTDAQEALDIIIRPPQGFVRLHGNDVRQKTIGSYLKKSPKEMARIFEIIRLQYIATRARCV